MAGANAYAAKLATSPRIIVIIPSHHNGSYKYEKPPEPALTPESPAFFSPTFLITKLDPMNALDDMAKLKPLILSIDTTMSGGIFSHELLEPGNKFLGLLLLELQEPILALGLLEV